jgi:hypothetical protein
MPKISYMVTDEYVRDWKRIHALREIISNGIDAEIEKRATLNVRHDSRTQKLYVRNDRTKLDVKALYFGGTTKADDDRLVGQYGEGLKIAMLVLAREKVPLRIHNCDEDWDVKIEPDERGVKVLTLYTRRSRNPDDCVEVEIGDVNNDLWYEARSMFLRLAPPLESFDTSYGQILPEVDQVGKVYVKGVLVGEFPKSAFGYNFRDLDVGRDRVSFDQSSAQTRIARMWEEAVTRGDEVGNLLFNAFLKHAEDMKGFAWLYLEKTGDTLKRLFQARFGEDAYPVSGSAQEAEIGHYGYRGVIVPESLVSALRYAYPGIQTIRQNFSQSVRETYPLDTLDPLERQNFLDAITWLVEASDKVSDVKERTTIVRFEDAGLMGLHSDRQIFISRLALGSFGLEIDGDTIGLT